MPQQRRRSGLIIGLLALGLLAGAALTAGPAQAVDAVGPYYALPSWDRKMAPANRFVVLTNWNSEAVLDKETGLMWEKSPSVIGDGVLWSAARSHCLGSTTGNRKGWRLPSIHELQSLIDPSVPSPAPMLPPGHPFLNVQFGQATPAAGQDIGRRRRTRTIRPSRGTCVSTLLAWAAPVRPPPSTTPGVCAGVSMRIRIEASVIGVIGSLGGAEGVRLPVAPEDHAGKDRPVSASSHHHQEVQHAANDDAADSSSDFSPSACSPEWP